MKSACIQCPRKHVDDYFEVVFRSDQSLSAIPPKADITAAQTNVRFVPKADIADAAIVLAAIARIGEFSPAVDAD